MLSVLLLAAAATLRPNLVVQTSQLADHAADATLGYQPALYDGSLIEWNETEPVARAAKVRS